MWMEDVHKLCQEIWERGSSEKFYGTLLIEKKRTNVLTREGQKALKNV